MTFNDIVNEAFIFEAKGKGLLLLDIDDTLVTAQNIFIHRKLPTDKEEVKLTPAEFAHEKVSPENKKYYDMREFKDPDKVARSISTGLPIVSNLKLMDNYIKNGWDIGILTARGMEDVIANTMKEWLMFRDQKGDLQQVGDKLVRDLVFAINTDTKHYKGTTDFERKANVIKRLAKKYDRIMFVDDDKKNIDAVREMTKRDKVKNVYVRLADKPSS